MADYFVPGMHLYLDQLIDWETILTLKRGSQTDVETDVAAFRSVLETAASLAESFEPDARKHWRAEAELTEDGGARSPARTGLARQAAASIRIVAIPDVAGFILCLIGVVFRVLGLSGHRGRW